MPILRKAGELGMIDREKAIKGLEVARDAIVDGYIHEQDRAVNAITDAIALLKEQEDRIGVLTRAIEQMPKPTKLLDVYGDGYAKIVRCKCCTHTEHCEIYGGFDGKNPDWFCADGERRDEDG